jgi:hypothetical protein
MESKIRQGPFKKSEVQKLWEGGGQVLLCEFRQSIAEKITWRDRGNGQMKSAPMLRHTVETESSTIIVNERVEETFDVNGYEAKFKKGQKVALFFSEMTVEKGVTSMRGELRQVTEG